MAYTKTTDFASKDSLLSGDPSKVVLGSEIDTEFENIETVIGTTTGSGAVVLATSPTLVAPVLGTPASGTVTNLTGTASININGTVGATTPNAGTFTQVLAGVTSATTNGGKIETSNGVTFPATQSACSNANTLDDYEEGTWTPSLSFTVSSTGLTYSFQKGKYTKIGNLVTVQCHLALSSLGSASGVPRITGLPFSGSTDTTNLTYNGSTALAYYGNITFGTDPFVYISPSNPSYIFFISQSGGITEADMTGTSYVTFCMTYFV